MRILRSPKFLRSSIICFVLLFGISLFASSEKTPGKIIYRAMLDDDIINPPVAEYIEGAIDKAEEDNAVCLIIELDTPGGLLTSTRTIVKKIMNSKIPVVTYVAPSGGRAGSAGVFITLASQVAAMAPSTNIGAAHPVSVGGDERESDESLGEALRKLFEQKEDEKGKTSKKAKKRKEPKAAPMEQKVLQDTTAWAKAIAEATGRNASWAVKAVTDSASATDTEAMRLGIIDIIADSTEDLVNKLDGRSVTIQGKKVKINTVGASIVDMPKGFRLRFLIALAHPNIAYILMMLGFYGLLFEVTHPGIGFPGIAGAFCLVLAFFGLEVLPTNYAGIALIVLAIAMFIAEVKITSYGLLTIGGLISMVVGSLILFKSPYAFMRVSLPIVAAFTLSTLAIAIFLITIVAKSQRRKAVTGTEGMTGTVGHVQSWSGDHGKIFVHGEIWDASGPNDLAKDAKVKVVESKGMELKVEIVQGEE
ncbi:MAG: nodulation protein NfeD [Pseudomonadota bacterium]